MAADARAHEGEALANEVVDYLEHITRSVLGQPTPRRDEFLSAIQPVLLGAGWTEERIEALRDTCWNAATKAAEKRAPDGAADKAALEAKTKTTAVLSQARDILAGVAAEKLLKEEECEERRRKRRERRAERRRRRRLQEEEKTISSLDTDSDSDEDRDSDPDITNFIVTEYKDATQTTWEVKLSGEDVIHEASLVGVQAVQDAGRKKTAIKSEDSHSLTLSTFGDDSTVALLRECCGPREEEAEAEAEKQHSSNGPGTSCSSQQQSDRGQPLEAGAAAPLAGDVQEEEEEEEEGPEAPGRVGCDGGGTPPPPAGDRYVEDAGLPLPHVLGSWLGAAGCADFGSPLPSPVASPWDGEVPSFIPLPPARQTTGGGASCPPSPSLPPAVPGRRRSASGHAAMRPPPGAGRGLERRISGDSSKPGTPTAVPAWPSTPDLFYHPSPPRLPVAEAGGGLCPGPLFPGAAGSMARAVGAVPELRGPAAGQALGPSTPQVVYVPIFMPHKCSHCGRECVPPEHLVPLLPEHLVPPLQFNAEGGGAA